MSDHVPNSASSASAHISEGPESDGIMCTSCNEATTISESKPYGKNPWVRRCQHCNNKYRCMQYAIAREKEDLEKDPATAGQVGTKARFWKTMSKEERIAWFRKEKRSEKEKGKRRDLHIVTEAGTDEKVWSKGRRSWDRLVPYSQYITEQKALGRNQSEIDADWRAMALEER